MECVNYIKEVEYEYKGEKYSVRDNGEVMRHSRENKRIRQEDNVWTYGKKGTNGYMFIGSHRIHIIIAKAFLGDKDSKIYVVDHKDTNRCNNRIENLRWVTRLENALLNPDTVKRITYLCNGDITKFIKDPSCLKNIGAENQDLSWMRTVTPQEAENAYKNVMRWGLKPITTTNQKRSDKEKGEWIFKNSSFKADEHQTQTFQKAKYPDTALQMDWHTPTSFMGCPTTFNNNGLNEYFNNLSKNSLFLKNRYSTQIVIDKVLINNKKELLVISKDISESAVKPFGLVSILSIGNQFIHKSISTYFEENGARKKYTEMQGVKWEGEDSIDNYC